MVRVQAATLDTRGVLLRHDSKCDGVGLLVNTSGISRATNGEGCKAVNETAQNVGLEAAGAELKRQAVGLAQGWQSLRKEGFAADRARPVLITVRQLLRLTERLKLAGLMRRAGEIEIALRILVEDQSAPTESQVRVLEAALSALASSAMALDLAMLASPPMANAANEAAPPAVLPSASSYQRKHVDRVVLLRADRQFLAGLASAVAEQGVDLLELDTPTEFAEYLRAELPSAVIIDARYLSALGRILPLLRASAGSHERDARIVVASSRRDMGRKLLAMRNGAHAYFEEPVDLLRMLAALGFEQRVADQTISKPVLIISREKDRALEQGRWLIPLHVVVRVADDVDSALQAVRDMRPMLIVVDDSIGTERGLALGQMLRLGAENGELPLLFTAQSNSLNERERAVATGFDEYLLKPVRARHLVGVVQSRLARAEKLEQSRQQKLRSKDGVLRRDVFVVHAARPINPEQRRAVLFLMLDGSERLHMELGLLGLGQLDRQMLQVLRTAFAPNDHIASFQDAMFLVMLERRDRDALFAAADQIRLAVSHAEFTVPGGRRKLSVSIGLCECPASQQGAETAVHNARAASVASAELGGNRCLWFDQHRSTVHGNAAVPVDTRVESNSKTTTPMVDLLPLLPLNGRLHNQYWLRLAWPPSMTGFPPIDHVAKLRSVDSAEASALDRQALELALEVRARELKRGKQVRLFIDLSSASVSEGKLAEWLARLLGERRQSGTGLTLCFDGSVGVDLHDPFIAMAPALNQLGIRLGLTSVGKDIAMVHHLRTLPIDFVMLMPEIVSGLSSDGRQPLIETLMRKAREAGSATIVPNVEQAEWLPRLKALRVDYLLSARFGPAMQHADFDFSLPLAN